MSTKPDRTDVNNLKRNFVEPLADPFSDKLKKNTLLERFQNSIEREVQTRQRKVTD
jgi:hypothetical protein